MSKLKDLNSKYKNLTIKSTDELNISLVQKESNKLKFKELRNISVQIT